MIGLCALARARGLTWAVPSVLASAMLAGVAANWLESRTWTDHLGRVPAVVLGGLAVAVLVVGVLHRTDEEIEGSVARPDRGLELGAVAGLTLLGGAVAVVWIDGWQLERGGLELVRNAAGLTGLALLGAALAGARSGWVLPFAYATVAYLGVTRDYDRDQWQATVGWLMFPATDVVSWMSAGTLLIAGLAGWLRWGYAPRPRWHHLR